MESRHKDFISRIIEIIVASMLSVIIGGFGVYFTIIRSQTNLIRDLQEVKKDVLDTKVLVSQNADVLETVYWNQQAVIDVVDKHLGKDRAILEQRQKLLDIRGKQLERDRERLKKDIEKNSWLEEKPPPPEKMPGYDTLARAIIENRRIPCLYWHISNDP